MLRLILLLVFCINCSGVNAYIFRIDYRTNEYQVCGEERHRLAVNTCNGGKLEVMRCSSREIGSNGVSIKRNVYLSCCEYKCSSVLRLREMYID